MWKEIMQDSHDYWDSFRNDVCCKKGFYAFMAAFGLFGPFFWLLCLILSAPFYPFWMLIMTSLTLQEYAEKRGQDMLEDHVKE